jgi:putative aldouronate transport system permease protein
MLFPGLVLLFIFRYIPLGGWIMAVKDYQLGMSMWSGSWTGLANFKAFFFDTGDAVFVIRNTLIINFFSIIASLVMSLVFALFLNELWSSKFKSIIQTSSLFPFFISWVKTYAIFSAFLSVNFGVINQFLVRAGFISEGINFMGHKDFSWPLMIFVNTWKTLGYNTVIFLAAIASINKEQYEAADIDGAGRFMKMRYISLPSLSATFMVLLIIHSGRVFTVSLEQYFLFTNTANRQTMEVFDMYIYRYGLQLLDISYATAVGVAKTIVSLFVFTSVNFLSKKLTGKGIV